MGQNKIPSAPDWAKPVLEEMAWVRQQALASIEIAYDVTWFEKALQIATEPYNTRPVAVNIRNCIYTFVCKIGDKYKLIIVDFINTEPCVQLPQMIFDGYNHEYFCAIRP